MVLTSTQNLCFEQKYEKIPEFLSENFHFLVVSFSVYLNRHVFVMITSQWITDSAAQQNVYHRFNHLKSFFFFFVLFLLNLISG